MTGKCKCSVFTKKLSFKKWTQSPLTCSASSCSGATPCTRTPSRPVCRHTQVLPCLANVGYSSILAFHQSRKFLSAPKGSFRYLLQQLRNSFANVKISKLGELIHLALSLSITLIVRFIDVKQSSFRLWSINLVSEGPVQSLGGESCCPQRCRPSLQSPQELPLSSL